MQDPFKIEVNIDGPTPNEEERRKLLRIYNQNANLHEAIQECGTYVLIQQGDLIISDARAITPILKALWQSTLIRYARLFNSGSPMGGKLFKVLTSEEVLLHEKLISDRNKYMAHFEDNDFERAMPTVDGGVVVIKTEGPMAYTMAEVLNHLQSLVEKMKVVIEDRVSRFNRRTRNSN